MSRRIGRRAIMEETERIKRYIEAGVDPRAATVLPKLDYTILIGACVYCFSRCQSLLIELLCALPYENFEQSELNDLTAGQICEIAEKYFDNKGDKATTPYQEFHKLHIRRDRIVHNSPCTVGDEGEQRLYTKERGEGGDRFVIDKQYMEDFIKQTTDLEYRLDNIRSLMAKQKDIEQ